MVLMAVVGVVLAVGTVLTLWWGGTDYETWEPGLGGEPDRGAPIPTRDLQTSVRSTVLRYLRGVAIALVGGFWAGALVTGPAVRLIMRLLAVTAGDDAQGRFTEADEVVGSINLDGTIALFLFGGILPGLLSGAIYVACRRLLPAGRLGGVTFGALHLVVAATRIDPLRPDNPDFDLVGPGWLSVATFGLASVLHGMAVAAIANRYSRSLPPKAATRANRVRAGLPLLLPMLLLVPGIALLVPIVVGLAITVAVSQIRPLLRAIRSRTALLAARVAVGITTIALLPGTITDLHDVIVRDDTAASTRLTQPHRVRPSDIDSKYRPSPRANLSAQRPRAPGRIDTSPTYDTSFGMKPTHPRSGHRHETRC